MSIMEFQPERRVFTIFCEILIFLLVILQGFCAYALAARMVCDVARDAYFFSRVILTFPGDSSGLARLFFSERVLLLLARAVNIQILSTMLVESFGVALCFDKSRLFRAGAMAILAGMRKKRTRAVHTIVLKAVGVLCVYMSAILSAFRLLEVLGVVEQPFMLLGGGALYLGGTVCITVVYRRLTHHDSGFGAVLEAGKFCVAVVSFALLGGVVLPVAVLTAFTSHVLAAGMAMNAVLCTVVVVTLVALPVVYLVLWDKDHPF